MDELSTAESRQLLSDFLESEDPLTAQELLVRIVESVIEPIALRLVQARLRITVSRNNDSALNQDALDIVSEVKVAMMSAIERVRNSASPGIIDSVEGYTAIVARNACNEYLRRKYPNRFRLRNQLRYVFTKTDGLSLSSDAGVGWICGTNESVEKFETLNAVPFSLNGSMPQLGNAISRRTGHASTIRLHELVEIVLDEIKRPVAFDDLVSIVAELRGIKEPVNVEITEPSIIGTEPGSVYREHDQRAFLLAVWREVLELPLNHRKALLLHLADDQNDNLLMMFTVAGVASIRMIADALKIKPEELATMWNRLPLPDNEISQMMGLERQQVINLRQSARRSLKLRLSNRGFFG